MDRAQFIRFHTRARISYERLAELLGTAWTERKFSSSTIGRWASGEAAIPQSLAPVLAFELGRQAGLKEQINNNQLNALLSEQDKILIDRGTYASLIELSNKAVEKLKTELGGHAE